MKKHYRAIWISDVHLGTRGCQAEYLLDFLDKHSSDKLYLVGDIIDGWVMGPNKVYWPQAHTNVVRKVLSKSKKGTEVIYVSGNHDEFLRNYEDLVFGNIKVVDEAIHTTADGREILVIHGDKFDVITRYHKWVAVLGDYGYRMLILANGWLNKLRQKFGKGYWSLSAFLKYKVKSAVNFIGEFESAVAYETKRKGMNAVICGHIHHAEIKEVDGVTYMNDGDWVESCTALVEEEDGTIKIVKWVEIGHEKANTDSN
jgi:UDP-2,3-diacylglucosamine pyrophosphatase LpxH